MERVVLSHRLVADIIGSRNIGCPRCQKGELIKYLRGCNVIAVACWNCGALVDLEATEVVIRLKPEEKKSES